MCPRQREKKWKHQGNREGKKMGGEKGKRILKGEKPGPKERVLKFGFKEGEKKAPPFLVKNPFFFWG